MATLLTRVFHFSIISFCHLQFTVKLLGFSSATSITATALII